jgi:hypothetical protein
MSLPALSLSMDESNGYAPSTDLNAPPPAPVFPRDEDPAEAALDEYHDGLQDAEVRAALEADPVGADTAFMPEVLDPSVTRFGESQPLSPACMWCNARLPVADAARCPSCGAILQPIDAEVDVPGLTTINDNARAALLRDDIRRQQATVDLSRPDGQVDPALVAATQLPRADLRSEPEGSEVYQPPSPEVRQMMRQIRLESFEADPVALVDPGPLAEPGNEEDTL